MVRVAACQFNPALVVKTRKMQVSAFLKKATCSNVDFICLPEGVLTGYYAEEELARKSALEVGKPAFEEWIHLIKETAPNATVIVGFNEREGNNLFDSAAIIESGELLGIQRKHYLYHSYFTAGNSFTSFQSKTVTFGVMICLDATYTICEKYIHKYTSFLVVFLIFHGGSHHARTKTASTSRYREISF